MSGYTIPGGSTVQPTLVAYRPVTLTATTTLVWPNQSQSATDYAARVMNVTANAGPFKLQLPPANQVSTGFDLIVANVGANSFIVADNSGNTLATLTAGQVYYLNLTDNSTVNGTWYNFLFGAGSSALSAGTAANASYDIIAIGQYLHANHAVTSTASSPIAINSDSVTNRGQTYVWTGGTGVLNLPLASAAGNGFYFNVINWGTGSLVITPTGGDTVDTSSTQTIQPGNACVVIAGAPGSWYTLGRGMLQTFNFTEGVISVTGGTLVESLTQAQNVVQKFTGTLTTNQTVTFPAIVQVFYVQNATAGAFTLTFGAAGGGSTVSVPQGQNMILFSDGTNVVNASNAQIGALSSISVAVGAANAPSINFLGDLTTGLYQPTSGTVAITTSGTERFRVTATGIQGNAFIPTGSSTPTNGLFLPSANTLGVAANSTQYGSLGSTGIWALTSNIASTTTGTGTLVITGGVGVSGQVTAATFAGALTGNVTGNVSGSSGSCTGNAATATSLSAGSTGALPYQSAAGTTAYLAAGTASQVLIGGATAPSWSNTPALTGTNFTGIPNGALTNSSVTVTAGTGMSGGGAVSLGGSVTLTNAGVTSIVAGTAVSISGATGAVTVNNTGVTSATGTTNQITVSASTGGVTFSTPQNIDTGANIQFGSLGVGTPASGTAGEIRATNNITAYYSDERLKTEIRMLGGALNRIHRLRGVTYRGNDVAASYGYDTKELQVGVIAQDVLKELPMAVKFAPFDRIHTIEGKEISKSGQDYLTVQYEKLVPLLIEAIKELDRKLDHHINKQYVLDKNEPRNQSYRVWSVGSACAKSAGKKRGAKCTTG